MFVHFPSSPIRDTWPNNPTILHLIALSYVLRYKVQTTNTSLTILSSHLLLPPLGVRTRVHTLFSNTLNLCSSPSVEDKVSHPHQTAGKPETWNITYNRNHMVLNDYIYGCIRRSRPEYGTKRHRKETRQHLITSAGLQYSACIPNVVGWNIP